MEVKFTSTRLRQELPTASSRIFHIEQTYLQKGWRVRRTVDVSDMSEEKNVWHLNKKIIKSSSTAGVDSVELEFEENETLCLDLIQTWSDLALAKVVKRRVKLPIKGPLIAEVDDFDEAWVLNGAKYLIEVEYDPTRDTLEDITLALQVYFDDLVNVSADGRYKNQNIARRIAERRAEVATFTAL